MNAKYQIPPKYEYKARHYRNINRSDIKELFTFVVRRLYFSERIDEFLTHNQLSNLLFGEKDSKDLKLIVNEYGNYFIRKGMKKKIDIEKVYEDHQYIWTGESKATKSYSKEQIIKAIDDEIKESYRQADKNSYPIHSIQKIGERGSLKLYSGIVDIDSDDAVNFSEGVTATFSDFKNSKLNVTILSYDNERDTISFQLTQEITVTKGSLKSSAVAILFKMKERINATSKNSCPLWHILDGKTNPSPVTFDNPIYENSLDKSQKIALNNSLKNNFTYIWGPPGTGKTHLLSRVIYNLSELEEKTVVCSIANIAVDGLLLKTIDLLKEQGYFQRNHFKQIDKAFLRLGYSQSNEVRNLKEIQFESKTLSQLSQEIKDLEERIREFNGSKDITEIDIQTKANLISTKDEIKKKYDAHAKLFLSQAKVIFLTSSKFIMENMMNEIEIDNLIIDEGSMMAIPSLVALAAKVKKRIIIAGDFQQLGPIALSNSEYAKRWLHNDLFSLLGDKKSIPNHKAVKMLNEQRRSAKDISKLINAPFYNNSLITIHQKHHDRKFNTPILKEYVSFLHLPDSEYNKAEFSRSHSKYNKLSKEKVWELFNKILTHEATDITIGIIAPYRQQVKDYKLLMKKYNISYERLTVGTIHTFQGSERDIIIWDIVDTPQNVMGSLYKGQTGERLVNVAISRAKSRLVIVGYPRTFHESRGNDLVSINIKTLISSAWNQYKKNLGIHINY